MFSTKISTKPCLDEQRSGASKGWDDNGLVEAAFEGRLARHDGVHVLHARVPVPEATPAAAPTPVSGTVPLHVPGSASQIPTVRLVETSRLDDSPTASVRARMIRAIGVLVVIVVTLLVADILS